MVLFTTNYFYHPSDSTLPKLWAKILDKGLSFSWSRELELCSLLHAILSDTWALSPLMCRAYRSLAATTNYGEGPVTIRSPVDHGCQNCSATYNFLIDVTVGHNKK